VARVGVEVPQERSRATLTSENVVTGGNGQKERIGTRNPRRCGPEGSRCQPPTHPTRMQSEPPSRR